KGLFLHFSRGLYRGKSARRSDPPRRRKPDARKPAQDARFDAELQCRRISGRFQPVESQWLQVRGVDRHQQGWKVCSLARCGPVSPPSSALSAVLEPVSLLKQFVADFVGAAKIFRTTRFVAFSDQHPYLHFGNLVSRACTQETF